MRACPRSSSAASELQVLPGQMARAARLARLGEASAVADLEQTRARFASLLQTLGQGGSHCHATLPPLPASMRPLLQDLDAEWQKNATLAARLAAKTRRSPAPALPCARSTRPAAPADAADQFGRRVAAMNGDASALRAAHALLLHAQRATLRANTLFSADADPAAA